MFTPKNEDIVYESRGNNTRRKSRDVSVVPSSVRALWQERSPSVAANSLMFSQVSFPCLRLPLPTNVFDVRFRG